MRLRCNSCRATWPAKPEGDASINPHTCPTEVIDTYAVCDEKGNVVTPATFKPLANPRNEHLIPDPDNPGRFRMASEGSGVTVIE